MINVSMGIDELLWLQGHFPGALTSSHHQVEWAIASGDEEAEVRYIRMELAAKRLLDAVTHAVERARANVWPPVPPDGKAQDKSA